MKNTRSPRITVEADLTDTRRKPTVVIRVAVGPVAVLYEATLRRFGIIALRAPHSAGGTPGASVAPELEAAIVEAARPHLCARTSP
jgi:hypothetical protein